MRPCRVLVTGASGSGTTSLGRALADAWSVPHAEVDDYFWVPTVVPYRVKRPEAERLELMQAVFAPRDAWVLSGSLMGWGDALIASLDAVVFLTLDGRVRLDRLNARETRRYGAAIVRGGVAAAEHRTFMDWARGYDDETFDGRSRVAHETWLSTLHCAVLRLDSSTSVTQLCAEVLGWERA